LNARHDPRIVVSYGRAVSLDGANSAQARRTHSLPELLEVEDCTPD